jgi:BASS family bile acid:Na+ symporter
MPWLIFAQLLFTFCRIDMKELRPKRWHLWMLMIVR